MNYRLIHDNIISRCKNRIYDSALYQNHHITPLHEDSNSKEVVPLTIKEHRIIHFLRYKMGYGIGNYKAYLFIKGIPNTETHLIISSKAGKIGSSIIIENNLGIFSESWDRSKETVRRHREGIIKVDKEIAKELGYYSVKSGKGIHNENWDFSAQSKKNWNNGIFENHLIFLKSGEIGKKYGHIGGNFCLENKIGIHDPEKRQEYASLGGKVSGKLPHWTDGISNKKSEECPGEGWYRGRTLKKYKKRGNLL